MCSHMYAIRATHLSDSGANRRLFACARRCFNRADGRGIQLQSDI